MMLIKSLGWAIVRKYVHISVTLLRSHFAKSPFSLIYLLCYIQLTKNPCHMRKTAESNAKKIQRLKIATSVKKTFSAIILTSQ